MLLKQGKQFIFSEEKQVHSFVLFAKCHKLRPSNFNYQLKIFVRKTVLALFN